MRRCPVAAWEGWTTKRNPHEDSEWAAAGNCRPAQSHTATERRNRAAVANQSLATHAKAGDLFDVRGRMGCSSSPVCTHEFVRFVKRQSRLQELLDRPEELLSERRHTRTPLLS